MTARKSGRIKKNLDYTSFLENDKSDESDDDFVGNSAPPPLKKVKSSQEEDALTPEKQKNNHASKSTKSKRKKIDEKVFERDIKMAMELSMQINAEVVTKNTPESKSSPCKIKSKMSEPQPHKELLYLSRHDIHSPPKSPPVLTVSVCGNKEEKEKKSTNKTPAMPILTPVNGPSDDIEFLGVNDEEEKKQTQNRRTSGRTAKKMIVYKPEDSDDDDNEQGLNDEEKKKQTRNRKISGRNAKKTIEYKPEDSDEDSDDEDSEFEEEESNSEENSDFEEKPKNKKQKQVLSTKAKKESKKQSQSITSNRVQQKTETKKPPSPSRPSLSSKSVNSTNSVKSVTKSVSSTAAGNMAPSSVNKHKTETVSARVTSVKIPSKMQTSTPLGKSAGNLTNMTSPPSIRRLGLSRNQKVKPLHPTLKVNN